MPCDTILQIVINVLRVAVADNSLGVEGKRAAFEWQ
jgi:hypothetical protein